MLATLLGAYTIVGFESATNLAGETHEPHRVIPKAMLRAVLVTGVVGFAFLIALAYATNKAAYASAALVAFIVHGVLGGVVLKIFLVFVVVSIFACGLIIMLTTPRPERRGSRPSPAGVPASPPAAPEISPDVLRQLRRQQRHDLPPECSARR